jgi:hypothetical protein
MKRKKHDDVIFEIKKSGAMFEIRPFYTDLDKYIDRKYKVPARKLPEFLKIIKKKYL